MYIISTNFVYTLVLPRSTLGLLPAIFGKFVTELWPLIYVSFSFSSLYLENQWIVFHQLFYMPSYCQDLALDYYLPFLANSQTELQSLIDVRFLFQLTIFRTWPFPA